MKKVGMTPFVADSYLELGRLNKHEKKPEEAKKCLNEAIRVYEQMSADFSLKTAREVLASLK